MLKAAATQLRSRAAVRRDFRQKRKPDFSQC